MSNVARYELRATEDSVGLFATEKPNTHGMQYVTASAYDALLAERDALKKDAERYRWLRNPDQDVALVLDKLTGHVPVDRFGGGGYPIYEYRAGEELDAAIDAALQGEQP